MKNKEGMLACLAFIRKAIELEDEDMLRSYCEQFYDLIPGE